MRRRIEIVEVSHNEFKQLLKLYYHKRKPVMVKGPTGVGKSVGVIEAFQEIAKEENLDFVEWNKISEKEKLSYLKDDAKRGNTLLFVDERVNLKDNTDNKGIPQLQGTEYLKWLKTLIINIAARENASVVFFKDEFNQACFPKGTKINVLNGLQSIENMKKGDIVLNRDGEYEKVSSVMQRKYDGTLYRFNITNLLPFECTEEHPILCCTRTRHKKLGRPEEFSGLIWKKAKEIQTDDFIAVPILKSNCNVKSLDLVPYQTDEVPKSIRLTLELSDELCWLFGLYVAEGYTNNSMVGLCLGAHEKELIEKAKAVIKRTLGHHIYEQRRDNSVTLRFAGRYVSKAFKEWFGDNARRKKIPDFVLRHQNLTFLTNFLRGYFEGDGSFPNKSAVSFGTASELLANQLQLAFTRYRLLVNVNKSTTKEAQILEKDKKRFIVGGRTVYTIKSHQNGIYDIIGVKGRKKQRTNRYAYYKDGYLLTKVREISKRKFNGTVYNFETEKTHTYIVNNAVVHNCPSVMNSEFQWILDKGIDDISFAEGVYTIAAGNRLEDKAQVSEMSAPLKNRFAHITLTPPSVEMWAEWAIKHNVDSRIIAFLHFRESYLFMFKEDLKDDAFGTPRAWIALSETIRDVTDIKLLKILAQSWIGDGAGHEFSKFVELEMKIDLDDYLKHPKKLEDIPSNKLDIKHAILSSAIERYRKKPEVLKDAVMFIQYLPPQFSIYFLKMLRMTNEKYFRQNVIKTKVWDEIRDNYGKYLLDE